MIYTNGEQVKVTAIEMVTAHTKSVSHKVNKHPYILTFIGMLSFSCKLHTYKAILKFDQLLLSHALVCREREKVWRNF